MINAQELYQYLDTVIPFALQEKWDNSGLLINSGEKTQKVLCCLDVTKQGVAFAIKNNCKIIVSHHPIIFGCVKSIDTQSILYALIQNKISVISAHTNFDKYEKGTCFNLHQFCGLKGMLTLLELGCVQKLKEALKPQDLVRTLHQNVKTPLHYTLGEQKIEKILFIAGSGKGMTEEILQQGCQCVVTGESSYHDMLDLQQMGITTVCLGHDVSEKISVNTLAKLVLEGFSSVQVVPFIQEDLVQYIY